ncbi:hypothetical protein [Ketogulonicigenium vulgare]|uniref:hypothetical protein n=1 Tax=Ketogulonicigenium vulgare TaxID=92945 RepID=UPI002359E082|nr:hypothetical protein [Ketogulonicigenium vulgare]
MTGKRFNFDLDEFQLSRLTTPVREKSDVIRFWLKATQLAISHLPPEEGTRVGGMQIIIDKMSRIFVEHGTKSFSVNYPFMVRRDDDRLRFYSHSCEDIDSRMIAIVMGLIDGEKLLLKNNVYDFVDPIFKEVDEDPQVWNLIKDLILADDGYLRVDHDPERENGRHHPLNHIDVFYSAGASFKVGLNSRVSVADFSDLLDLRTECHFLSK